MAIWFGTQNSTGDTSTVGDDIIQDNMKIKTGSDREFSVDIAHFYFYCADPIEVQVDDNAPQWLSAGLELEFKTEFDRAKMPKKNFKLLTEGLTYEYAIIIK